MSSVPEQLGDFRVEKEIGRGGFGIVYRAHQVSLDRPVALKVLYRHLIHTQEQISRFEREARAAARLDHPAIVSVFAWGDDKDDFYIAQRLIGHGRTMADDLQDLREGDGAPKGWFRKVAELLIPIAEALQQAHDRGIVHRDVKPSNILLDSQGHPNLGDFGLAKVEDGLELSRTGDFAGSPYYMAPEQADGRRGPVDHRSDIYALGVTLYEMLTLTQPFLGSTSHEIIRKILSEDPKPPSKIESRVPKDLETICLHAMEKTSARRYASALDLAHDLQAFLDGEPINAVPIGTTRMIARKVRRNGPSVALAGMALAIVAITWHFTNTGREQEQQIEKLTTAVKEQTLERTTEELEQTAAAEQEAVDEELAPQIEAAIESGDTERVQELEAERQARVEEIAETYDAAKQHVADFLAQADKDAVTDIATGIMAQGLFGALDAMGLVDPSAAPAPVGAAGIAGQEAAVVGEPVAESVVAQADEEVDPTEAVDPEVEEDEDRVLFDFSPFGLSVRRASDAARSALSRLDDLPEPAVDAEEYMPDGPPVASDGRAGNATVGLPKGMKDAEDDGEPEPLGSDDSPSSGSGAGGGSASSGG